MFSLIACCSSFPAICASLSLCVWVCVREDDQQLLLGKMHTNWWGIWVRIRWLLSHVIKRNPLSQNNMYCRLVKEKQIKRSLLWTLFYSIFYNNVHFSLAKEKTIKCRCYELCLTQFAYQSNNSRFNLIKTTPRMDERRIFLPNSLKV